MIVCLAAVSFEARQSRRVRQDVVLRLIRRRACEDAWVGRRAAWTWLALLAPVYASTLGHALQLLMGMARDTTAAGIQLQGPRTDLYGAGDAVFHTTVLEHGQQGLTGS